MAVVKSAWRRFVLVGLSLLFSRVLTWPSRMTSWAAPAPARIEVRRGLLLNVAAGKRNYGLELKKGFPHLTLSSLNLAPLKVPLAVGAYDMRAATAPMPAAPAASGTACTVNPGIPVPPPPTTHTSVTDKTIPVPATCTHTTHYAVSDVVGTCADFEQVHCCWTNGVQGACQTTVTGQSCHPCTPAECSLTCPTYCPC